MTTLQIIHSQLEEAAYRITDNFCYSCYKVINADAFQMPHEIVTAAGWAGVALDDLITAVAEVVGDTIGGFFKLAVDDLQCGHG